ncbi:MAG: hypothetical protein NZO16_02305 [Deltaproteobacteria bacterium]|nr:hypothetical protein [Deltaproteobacteria bacterium]
MLVYELSPTINPMTRTPVNVKHVREIVKRFVNQINPEEISLRVFFETAYLGSERMKCLREIHDELLRLKSGCVEAVEFYNSGEPEWSRNLPNVRTILELGSQASEPVRLPEPAIIMSYEEILRKVSLLVPHERRPKQARSWLEALSYSFQPIVIEGGQNFSVSELYFRREIERIIRTSNHPDLKPVTEDYNKVRALVEFSSSIFPILISEEERAILLESKIGLPIGFGALTRIYLAFKTILASGSTSETNIK